MQPPGSAMPIGPPIIRAAHYSATDRKPCGWKCRTDYSHLPFTTTNPVGAGLAEFSFWRIQSKKEYITRGLLKLYDSILNFLLR